MVLSLATYRVILGLHRTATPLLTSLRQKNMASYCTNRSCMLGLGSLSSRLLSTMDLGSQQLSEGHSSCDLSCFLGSSCVSLSNACWRERAIAKSRSASIFFAESAQHTTPFQIMFFNDRRRARLLWTSCEVDLSSNEALLNNDSFCHIFDILRT